MNTKWFEDKLQAAVTYDQTYCPDVMVTAAKRFMISTQVSLLIFKAVFIKKKGFPIWEALFIWLNILRR